MKKKEYNVYIDESGDEGIRRGSKYFILTAILVEKEKDLEISKAVDKIKLDLELDVKAHLHWNKIKGIANKKSIISTICKQDIIIINIIIDTEEIKFIRQKDMYNYFSGYLYERICKIMKQEKAIANIYISSRVALNKKGLMSYLKNHNDKHEIDYTRINQVKIYPNKQRKLLQMADCCCSSLGQALKYNDDNHCSIYEPLLKKAYVENGTIVNSGLKFVPPKSIPNNFKLFKQILKKQPTL